MNRERYAFLMLSMTMEEARSLLGFGLNDSPSKSEINQAWKKRIFERHPDRGGDHSDAVELNAARDILEGKMRPTYDRSSPSPSPSPSPGPVRYEPPKKTGTTFDEAKSKAGIPGGVAWLFVTPMQKGRGWGGNESSQSDVSWVAYGRTDSKHVFVAARHYTRQDNYIGGTENTDDWTIKKFEFPIKDLTKEGHSPRWLYGNVVKALKGVDFGGKFNSKVLSAEGWRFDARLPKGSAVSIKHWLVNSGQMAGDDPSVSGRKHVVEVIYKEDFNSRKESLILKVNGKDYPVHDDDYKEFAKLRINGRRAKRAIFGEYAYDDTKKNLTRMRTGKEILNWMSQKFRHLPAPAREVLEQASAQMK